MNFKIQIIKPGDTRHLATINMVLNDFSPILVKDFAGHSDIDTTYHYFGNIGNLVKCISYYKYRELREYTEDEVLSASNPKDVSLNSILANMDNNGDFVEVDDGLCISPRFKAGKITDCQLVGGDCKVCDFIKKTHAESKESRITRLQEYEKRMNREGKLLDSLLADYKGSIVEDRLISESITKIRSDSSRYLKEVELKGGYYNEQ